MESGSLLGRPHLPGSDHSALHWLILWRNRRLAELSYGVWSENYISESTSVCDLSRGQWQALKEAFAGGSFWGDTNIPWKLVSFEPPRGSPVNPQSDNSITVHLTFFSP